MNTAIIIRSEKESDAHKISSILRAAFEGHPFSKNNEHQMVDSLRQAGELKISLVALQGENIVGYVAFSPVNVDGKDIRWLGLGPIAVHPSFQKQGIGKALINAGLAKLRKKEAAGCVVLGDPGYYLKSGFTQEHQLILDSVPPEYFMAMALTGPLPTGRVEYHKAFYA